MARACLQTEAITSSEGVSHYIGLMSGTSLDGADGVLLAFDECSGRQAVVAHATQPFTDELKAELLALNTPGDNEIHRAAGASSQLAQVYAQVVKRLLAQTAEPISVTAIGAHGQTVRHRPGGTAGLPHSAYTVQLNHPALLAELTGIDVVADFRSRDIAAGGQGAPLVPAFHQQVFGRPDAVVMVLNIGGIANITVVPPLRDTDAAVTGFDCGPGNALIDAWCHRQTGQAFDANGDWAASGKLVSPLLDILLATPYFSEPPPKSTGRDLFSLEWLARKLAPFAHHLPADIQNTLTEFTARVCIDSVSAHLAGCNALIVCGGGAFNGHLMQRLEAGLPGLQVQSSAEHGLPPLQVEAAAFAWLARQTVHRLPGNLSSVTGAAGGRVLGAIYPA